MQPGPTNPMLLFVLKNVLRLLGAGLFVFVGLGLSVAFISRFFPDARPLWIVVPLLVVGFFVFVVLAMVLFSAKGPRRISADAYAARIRKLEDDGLLILQSYQARRAFQVDEFEDEGSSYFIEVEDLSVLFLTGQYLYEYEPLAKSRNSQARPRRFPSTEFIVRRHKENGYAVDILCRGAVLDPEVLSPSFDDSDFENNLIPKDGAIIREKTYDQIKRDRLKQK
jgi:hypothetical protein